MALGIRSIANIVKGLGILRPLNITLRRRIRNTPFKVPILRELGLGNLKQHEPWMGSAITAMTDLKQGAFVDVGANIGQTFLELRAVAPHTRYVGIEPNPVCVAYLHELLRVNAVENAQLVHAAVSDRCGVVELFFYGAFEDGLSASVVTGSRPNMKAHHAQHVAALTFEQSWADTGVQDVSVMKIDVEGAECEVLKGAGSVVEDSRPFILLEILPLYSSGNSARRERQEWIEGWVREHDYTIFRISKTTNGALCSFQSLHSIGTHSDLNACDYAIVPQELRSGLMNAVRFTE